MDIKKEETHVKKTEITDYSASENIKNEPSKEPSFWQLFKAEGFRGLQIILVFVVSAAAAIYLYKCSLDNCSYRQATETSDCVIMHIKDSISDTIIHVTKTRTSNNEKKKEY